MNTSRLLLFVFLMCPVCLAAEARPLPRGLPSGEAPSPPHWALITKVNKRQGYVLYREVTPRSPQGPVSASAPAGNAAPPRNGIVATDKRFEVGTGKIYEGDGSEVAPAEFWRQVEVGQVVLVSNSGRRPHSSYRKLLRKEALILAPRNDAVPTSSATPAAVKK